MSEVLPAKDMDFQARGAAPKPFLSVTGSNTPLAKKLSSTERIWLMRHLTDRYNALDTNMIGWRGQMAKWERMSEEDYSDRVDAKDEVNNSSVNDIFSSQNESLGVVASFCDFHFAQVKDDIFGTRPWLAATPEGKDDSDLADVLSKFAQWKINQSNVEPALLDALKVSTWGGTAFIKASHLREVESYEKIGNVAVWTDLGKEPGEKIKSRSGAYVTTLEELEAMGVSAEQIKWKQTAIADTRMVYSNVVNDLIDYRDIAFETTAPELNLLRTDVFLKFRMGLIDLMDRYQIDKEHAPQLLAILGAPGVAKDHRDETDPGQDIHPERAGNPIITLIEGFVRCAPFASQKPICIHAIFAPDLNVLFSVDYLANVTPGGMLPVFPIRINRKPSRIFGMGYFEKYDKPNKAIDRQYNLITYRNRYNAHVYTAFQPNALADDSEGKNEVSADPQTPYKLAEGKSIDDLIQFKAAPDTNGRAEMLLNSQLQMVQMRSGITSAAQGELKGVPNASTATGVKDLQSRGATIVKSPVSEQTEDIRAIVEYDVILICANQDASETFSWGEGREAKLLEIDAEKVLGLKANVALTLTQSQNMKKLESSQTAISTVMNWFQVPEVEKPSVRYAFVQALSAVGFHNAEDIIRKATADPEGILSLMPPDIAPVVEQALVQAGLLPLPTPESASQENPAADIAPVSGEQPIP
jgi:hypothetical protein